MRFLKIFFVLVIFIFTGCKNQESQNSEESSEFTDNSASVIFEKTTHDFGKIIQGEVVSYTFLFENNGSSNLIINDVKASCGCTTPEWTKEPVVPGGEGKIVVSFDSSGRSGSQQKVITVYSNSSTKNVVRLTITAEIINNK